MSTMEDSYDSLIGALLKARIPADNQAFIRRIMSAIGIAEYFVRGSTHTPFVVARRCDGLPNLRIYYGYTTGFVSAEEAVRAAGGGAKPDSSRSGTWWVEHPTNRVRDAGGRPHDVRREAGYCDCGMQKSLNGKCPTCDE
ncbi:hypothetical protein EUA02_05725 [Mycobacterium paragordonae]|nr:hypothetical protein A9W97_26665 [Mycobacterium gordonae]OBK48295.1 hypothetical protein A5656_29830 [Mycobacterium gordonae]TDL00801.1 hypothetical protein EUA02_05725 [Mycobacterium paragordonae]TDL09268.1 hypothetical protein EUA05_06665 [Mycobacterium paragordonae]